MEVFARDRRKHTPFGGDGPARIPPTQPSFLLKLLQEPVQQPPPWPPWQMVLSAHHCHTVHFVSAQHACAHESASVAGVSCNPLHCWPFAGLKSVVLQARLAAAKAVMNIIGSHKLLASLYEKENSFIPVHSILKMRKKTRRPLIQIQCNHKDQHHSFFLRTVLEIAGTDALFHCQKAHR